VHDPPAATEVGGLLMASAGAYEAIYQNMPVMGLQKAGRPLTVTEARDSARARLSAR
jgi:hypothetical protein